MRHFQITDGAVGILRPPDEKSPGAFWGAKKYEKINVGEYKAIDNSEKVTGAMIIVTIVDTCLSSGDAVTTINDGTYTLGGEAINLFRNFPTHHTGVTTTLNINGGTFNKNPDDEISYIWNHQSDARYQAFMNFNGGTYNAIVYEDYAGHDDIRVSQAAVDGGLSAYSGNN